MRIRHSVIGVVGVLVWLLATLFVTGSAQASSAQAAAPVKAGTGGQLRVAPPAPEGARTASDLTVAAVSPTISPSVRYVHVATGEWYTCDWGNLCGEVWDPVVGKWKIFYLYTCNRYALSNWNGMGDYINAQTDGAVGTFYGQNGGVLRTVAADAVEHPQDWSPVWYIRNC
ncbi:hypothetical protein [Streptomyces sp. NPDC050535]|uniref:hypothetical protein n=1 Tax=Streptomyces sp. NPDC050535 TaxID=3365626 RepID=UPI00378825F2